MSVLTPKRVFPVVAALLLAATAWASNPSPRTLSRMAFDSKNGVGVLFGGRGLLDNSTKLYHNTNETWLWNGRWQQVFPEHAPPARGAHNLVYDSARERTVLFGGRVESEDAAHPEPTFVNDTWIYQNGDWTQLEIADAPPARHLAGMAYDASRDRIVLYGGNHFTAGTTTLEPLYDTWEFDGTNWTQIGSATGMTVVKPILTYDEARHEILMVGMESVDSLTTVTFRYHADSGTWEKLTSEKNPACVNEGGTAYQQHNQTVLLFGGVCTGSTPTLGETWEWNGTKWNEITTNVSNRTVDEAMMYDAWRQETIAFGGTPAFSTVPQSVTTRYRDAKWLFASDAVRPAPRSLYAFATDPVSNTIWMLGGLNETGALYLDDFWSYHNGQWSVIPFDQNQPVGCVTPLAAFDTNRSKLVVTCAGSETYEWDGLKWAAYAPKNTPTGRRFANMVYDAQLKKVVLFGGHDGTNFRNDTWTWDGTNWTEVKKDRPPNRASFAMWYDPLLKKTVIFGGFGRPNLDSSTIRYDDMWSFDGSSWTKISVSEHPGGRFNPYIGTDPATGKILLFGGMRWELVSAETNTFRQWYDNDMWEWDGATSKWKQLTPARVPNVRENGIIAFDPVAQKLTMFAGFSRGLYYSDVWTWDGQTWTPQDETVRRRRSVIPRH